MTGTPVRRARQLLGELAAIARTAPRWLEDQLHHAAAGLHRPYDCAAPEGIDHEVRCGTCGVTWPCPEVSAITARMGAAGRLAHAWEVAGLHTEVERKWAFSVCRACPPNTDWSCDYYDAAAETIRELREAQPQEEEAP